MPGGMRACHTHCTAAAPLSGPQVSVDRLAESDLDYANSVASLASLRGRLKLAIANFQGCSGEYVNFVKKVRSVGGCWAGCGTKCGRSKVVHRTAGVHRSLAAAQTAAVAPPAHNLPPHPAVHSSLPTRRPSTWRRCARRGSTA